MKTSCEAEGGDRGRLQRGFSKGNRESCMDMTRNAKRS